MKNKYLLGLLLAPLFLFSQTETDGLFMSKNYFCFGTVYQHNNWNEYWEGDFKRENLNLGTVSSSSLAVMGNYGLTKKLNVLVSLPYVKTKASAGTLAGQEGVQDVTLSLKHLTFKRKINRTAYTLYTVLGVSTPLSDYAADFLPLSIGAKSKTATLRLIADYQNKRFFTTFSAAYVKRASIEIDRNSYFTTKPYYTNRVDMPDVINVNYKIGYRTNTFIAEASLENMVTQSGGFDITSNNMPFPSNTMNALRTGAFTKYSPKQNPRLSFLAGCNYTLNGRNVGQTTSIYGGLFYILNFNKKQS
ncbi:hypothetical protein [Flavobacterium turcicum]|uniref:Transporter n=1 Tax=Flavobacterium turcicum TaxID=2764718 RepID=A0ABR7JBL5_9FLAO|nr:hypothetical protein [Flavobacterium turcicum]MBC5861814.1 hypothetical protein [Flavobacterium turcicum]NHL00545.1 hypothetical protein [Flavobacterium turcicum]